MVGITGQNTSISWVWSGGTVSLDTDYRSANYDTTIEMYDQTAGADQYKTYITGVKDGSFSYGGVFQSGGTAIVAALERGNSGTIIYGPEGTAVGKEKITIPAISKGAKRNNPFNNLIEISCDFQQNGAEVRGAF